MSNIEERTYQNLLAPLGADPSVWAECLFIDPVSDIALLGTPDGQAGLFDEARNYSALVEAEAVAPLRVEPPGNEGWLLALSGAWFRCTIEAQPNGPLWFTNLEGKVIGGMSGSPVISAAGAAVGVVCTSSECPDGIDPRFHGPNPSLVRNLPGWLLSEVLNFTQAKDD